MNRAEFLVGVVLAAAAFQVSAANLINPEWAGKELHLVDDDAGTTNSNLYWTISGGALKGLRGKPLYFAAHVKQMRASRIDAVGISISAFRKGGPDVGDGALVACYGQVDIFMSVENSSSAGDGDSRVFCPDDDPIVFPFYAYGTVKAELILLDP